MSKSNKIALGIIALAAVVGIAYYWNQTHESAEPAETSSENATLPTGSSTTDSSIEQDLSSIDAQMRGVSQDNTNTNTSVNAASAQ